MNQTALVVVSHHRADSLTVHISGVVAARLERAGYEVDLLDLHAEGFDPRMTVADQPDWNDRDKVYSEEVRRHQARIAAADVIIPVFPVYWYGLPALLKGWVDRVWNYGFAYGRSKPRLAGKRMLWLGLAGLEADDPLAPIIRESMGQQLNVGISEYCGIPDAATEILYNSEAQPQAIDDKGNLVIGEALEGGAREAHYAAFDRAAEEYVEKFLALP
jgi:putative NADPH-quinone reductase